MSQTELAVLRQSLAHATIPRWEHGAGPFMDQPQHVLLSTSRVGLQPVIALSETSAGAGSIAKLRQLAVIYAAAAYSITQVALKGGIPSSTALELWYASWAGNNSLWSEQGWDPVTRATVVTACDDDDNWIVSPSKRPGQPFGFSASSRESVMARSALFHTVDGPWKAVDDGTGQNAFRLLTDSEGNRVGIFPREQDAAFIVEARSVLAIIGGQLEHLLTHCTESNEAVLTYDEVVTLLESGQPWPTGPAATYTATRGR